MLCGSLTFDTGQSVWRANATALSCTTHRRIVIAVPWPSITVQCDVPDTPLQSSLV
jgi:hypothetical protein